MGKIKIALPKGRLFQESVDLLFEREVIPDRVEEGRKLAVEVGDLTVLLVKPFDVPVYVEKGVADLGICGFDIYLERKPDVYRILDLGIGACRISLAGKPQAVELYKKATHLRVATKYPSISERFFQAKGIKAEVVHLSGSVELAPLIGLSDFIVDLVQTGRTLKENGLVEIEVIDHSTAWLLCNKASFRSKRDEIARILRKLSR